jgi:23S rRNA pseudouridine1911/1915/1917 synthase
MSPSDSERCQRHTVPPAEADARLDRFLARRHQGLGRRDAAALIAEGAVRIQRGEGQAPVGARKGDRLRAGDVVVVTASEARLARHRAETPPWPAAVEGVHIRHVDDELVVLAKPAGVPTHPLRPGEAGTAANHLALRHP